MKMQKETLKSRDITTLISLPEEIIEEILSRIEVQSLLRFRCVSKSWRSLIDSKRFMKTHYQNSTKNLNFPHQRFILHPLHDPPMQCSLQNLLNETPTKPTRFDVPIYIDWTSDDPVDIDWTEYETLGCYNGLVCIVDQWEYFFLWNPSTRIAKKLPEQTNRCSYVQYPGFGWIESTGEYKVFAVVLVLNNRQVAEVYSSKTKSWKTLQQWDLPGYCYHGGVCVSEKLHWDSDEGIVCFDLKSEVIGTIPLPSKMDGEQSLLRLGVIGGCLCVLCNYRKRGVRVWVMKEYGVKESWERVVSLPQLLQRPFSSPLIIGPNGEILVFFGPDYIIYYPQHNVFLCPRIWYADGLRYIESLLSPEIV